MSDEKARPIFVVCPTCDGVGFILFESIAFAGIEEPDGLIRSKCDMCGGTGEIVDEPITIKVKASEWDRVTRERDNVILELGGIQSMIAEVLNLSKTPTTSEEIRLALEAHVVESPSNPET
jgi:hypothetical protein